MCYPFGLSGVSELRSVYQRRTNRLCITRRVPQSGAGCCHLWLVKPTTTHAKTYSTAAGVHILQAEREGGPPLKMVRRLRDSPTDEIVTSPVYRMRLTDGPCPLEGNRTYPSVFSDLPASWRPRAIRSCGLDAMLRTY